MAILRFQIVPNAKQNKMTGEHGGAIKIKLRAPPLKGKANAALRSFLAEELEISERRILLERGEKSRDKLVRIRRLERPLSVSMRRRCARSSEWRTHRL
jgi:uncharacterized protein